SLDHAVHEPALHHAVRRALRAVDSPVTLFRAEGSSLRPNLLLRQAAVAMQPRDLLFGSLPLEVELERWHAEQLLLLRVDPLDPREGVVQVKADLGDVLRGTLRGSHFVAELVDQRMLDPRTVQVDRRAEV